MDNQYLELVQSLPGRRKSAPHRARILQFIEDYIQEHGFSPGLRDVALGIELSMGATRQHLLALKAHRLVDYQPGLPRTIVLGPMARPDELARVALGLGELAHVQENP